MYHMYFSEVKSYPWLPEGLRKNCAGLEVAAETECSVTTEKCMKGEKYAANLMAA